MQSSLLVLCYYISGQSFFVSIDESTTLSFSQILFPSLSSSSVPSNRLLNMSFDCATGQLDIHTELNGGIEIIPKVLSFNNIILLLKVKVAGKVTFDSLIMNGNAQLFGETTFVAVRYDFKAHTFSFPPPLVLLVRQLADHLPTLKTTLPRTVSEIAYSVITAFSYSPKSKELSIHSTAPEVFVVPNVIKLTSAKFSMSTLIGSSPSLKNLSFSGKWKIGAHVLVTSLRYNGPKQLFHVSSTVSSRSAKYLIQKISDITNSLYTH